MPLCFESFSQISVMKVKLDSNVKITHFEYIDTFFKTLLNRKIAVKSFCF